KPTMRASAPPPLFGCFLSVPPPAPGALVLEGEDPATEDSVDARHWHAIYSRLMGVTLRRIASGGADAELEERAARYERRLEFWLQKGWELDNVCVDEVRRTISGGGGTLTFSKREFQLVKFLLERPGQGCSCSELLAGAWQNPALPEEAVRTCIGRVRRKLQDVDLAVIVTDPRRGYRLEFTDGQAMTAPLASQL
ncbi:MAG: winged helix-turn-helix domain-containing protein, partial [Candidatus Dormibacteria bacterium]